MAHDRLRLGHERMLLALDQFERQLPTLTAETIPDLVDARWNFARQALTHIDREEDHLFAPLEADDRPGTAELVARFRAERARVTARFQAHARRYWTDEDIVANLDGYRAALLPLLAEMRAALLAKARLLYPLLESLAPTGAAPPAEPCRKWSAQIARYRSAAPAARSEP